MEIVSRSPGEIHGTGRVESGDCRSDCAHESTVAVGRMPSDVFSLVCIILASTHEIHQASAVAQASTVAFCCVRSFEPRGDGSFWYEAAGPPNSTLLSQLKGMVQEERSVSLAAMRKLGVRAYEMDWHCVTGWSYTGLQLQGIPLDDFIEQICRPLPGWQSREFLVVRSHIRGCVRACLWECVCIPVHSSCMPWSCCCTLAGTSLVVTVSMKDTCHQAILIAILFEILLRISFHVHEV